VERVVVIGAGISGLSAAHRLTEIAPALEVTVLEATDRAGGLCRSERHGALLVEGGPDSILTDKPWALELARRIGLEREIISTRNDNRGSYVVCRGRLERVPEGFTLLAPVRVMPFLTTRTLSLRGKARAALEIALPRGARGDDESLASFVRRRFGHEVLERLAQPLVSGIYGADPEELSLRATMPRFLDLERDVRSVTLGLMRASRRKAAGPATGARYAMFISFREGIETLPKALASRLGTRIRYGAEVRALERRVPAVAASARQWSVVLESGERVDADAVIVAIHAHAAARLVAPLEPDLSRALAGLSYGSTASVTLALDRSDVPHPLDAFGFVVPSIERRPILACTWSSVKYEGRAPAGTALLRVFFGGPSAAAMLAGATDVELEALARSELEALLGIAKTAPAQLVRVHRHLSAMPQYRVGHADRVAEIEERVQRLGGGRFALAGNAYRGVGLPDSVRSGEAAASAVAQAGLGAGRDVVDRADPR